MNADKVKNKTMNIEPLIAVRFYRRSSASIGGSRFSGCKL